MQSVLGACDFDMFSALSSSLDVVPSHKSSPLLRYRIPDHVTTPPVRVDVAKPLLSIALWSVEDGLYK